MTPVPAPQQTESIEREFQRLAAVWDRETRYLSDSDAAARHPAYQAIIQLGPAVIPFLLRDMEKTHQHWFEALMHITGANPIPAADCGRIPRMVEAWLRWGRENGYRW
jgi:hypothetical protein